jgi:hypothetical protein
MCEIVVLPEMGAWRYLVVDGEGFAEGDFGFVKAALLKLGLALEEFLGEFLGGELGQAPTVRHPVVGFELVSGARTTQHGRCLMKLRGGTHNIFLSSALDRTSWTGIGTLLSYCVQPGTPLHGSLRL